MSQRGARGNNFEDRDYYPPPRPRRADPRYDDDYGRPQRAMARSPPPRPFREVDEMDVRIRERDREAERNVPSFLRDEPRRRQDSGPMVLRERDVETREVDHGAETRERAVETKEVDEVDVRIRERDERRNNPPPLAREDARRSDAPPMVLRRRDVETWDRHDPRRRRSPTPPMREVEEERMFIRRPRSESPPHMHEREREYDHEFLRKRVIETEERRRSPPPGRRRSPPAHEHIHTRIVERETASSPSPPPPPKVHAKDSTDIDITVTKDRTEVDIHKSGSRSRSRSRSHERRRQDEEFIIERDMERLRVDDHRRAHSADDEADYLRSRVEGRGRPGETWGGATKDWTIVDVPPGTERVRMDGAGGASIETNWTQYSGVRRTQFIPERDGVLVPVEEPAPAPAPGPGLGPVREHTSIAVVDGNREIDVDIDRRVGRPARTRPSARETWTEITKDLVCRRAIEELGYRYEETRVFFYIMEYLKQVSVRYQRFDQSLTLLQREVMELIDLTEAIRRHRRRHQRHELEWDIDWRDDWGRRRRRHRHDGWVLDDERVYETQVIYDRRGTRFR